MTTSDDLNAYLAVCGVPKELRHIQPDEKRIPTAVWEWGRAWNAGGRLVLAGPTGTGKSMALQWAIRRRWHHLTEKQRPAPVLTWTTGHAIARAVHEGRREQLTRWRDAAVLIIDDLGSQYPGQFSTAEIEGLICARCDQRRPIAISTNLLPISEHQPNAETLGALMPRAYSRLAAEEPGPGICIMDGPDLRLGPPVPDNSTR